MIELSGKHEKEKVAGARTAAAEGNRISGKCRSSRNGQDKLPDGSPALKRGLRNELAEV
jgi:hypothetical protein